MATQRQQATLISWYQTIVGRRLFEREGRLLADGLQGLFGHYLISLGPLDYAPGMVASPIRHKMIMNDRQLSAAVPDLLGDQCNLPLQNDSVDVAVLPHLLEYSRHPHSILRELERVIMPDGYMVILGFNPVSSYGVCRLLSGWRQRMPWQGHYYHPVRLRDWIQLLGFKIVKLKYCGFVPPIPHAATQRRLAWMERASDYSVALLGGVYMIVARNQTMAPSVIKRPWEGKRAVVNGVVEPTTRTSGSHDA